jgi:putative membrane protein
MSAPAVADNARIVMNFLFNPRYPKIILVLFLLFAGAWAFNPVDRKDWALENALTLIFVVLLIVTYRRMRFSNISYTLIFLFMCLHTIGAHYTYSKVPYNDWSAAVFGRSINSVFGVERNYYDRLVHFSFGFLLAYPIRELFMRVAGARGFWGYYLPLDLTMSFSMVYELIEWAVAILAGGELGIAYLGAQGDIWDAQKDMALASLGAVMSMIVVALINWKFNKNFGAEMRDSLTPKDLELGEGKLRDMMRAGE